MIETLLLTLLLSLFETGAAAYLINTDVALGEWGKTPADGGVTAKKHAYNYSDYGPDNYVKNYVNKIIKLKHKNKSVKNISSELEQLLFPTRLKRSIDKEDQDVESAIVSVQYTDKLGRVKTLKGNADKLLIKRRRRPHKTGILSASLFSQGMKVTQVKFK